MENEETKEQEQEKEKEQEQEQEEAMTYAKALEAIKSEYEARISALNADYLEKLNERDDIIKSLTLGETFEQPKSVADMVNEKRAKDNHW